MANATPYNANGKRVCGANLRNKPGKTCHSPLVMENGRCRIHGGKSPQGIAQPMFKHGRYSKYMPARLLERYTEAANDPELLNMRHDIALLDSRLADVLTRVDTGESGAMWLNVKTKLEAYKRSRHTDNDVLMLGQLSDAIDEGYSDTAAWTEIGELIEQRRKLVESEGKRLVAMQQMITAERATLLIGALVGIIRTHVTDNKVLSAISADVGKLLNSGSSITSEAESRDGL